MGGTLSCPSPLPVGNYRLRLELYENGRAYQKTECAFRAVSLQPWQRKPNKRGAARSGKRFRHTETPHTLSRERQGITPAESLRQRLRNG